MIFWYLVVTSWEPIGHHINDTVVVSVGTFLSESFNIFLRLRVPAGCTISKTDSLVSVVNSSLHSKNIYEK